MKKNKMEEFKATIWADGGPLWISWAFAVTLSSILGGLLSYFPFSQLSGYG
jgi:hypothetical protein